MNSIPFVGPKFKRRSFLPPTFFFDRKVKIGVIPIVIYCDIVLLR